jgi:hypothetical protein
MYAYANAVVTRYTIRMPIWSSLTTNACTSSHGITLHCRCLLNEKSKTNLILCVIAENHFFTPIVYYKLTSQLAYDTIFHSEYEITRSCKFKNIIRCLYKDPALAIMRRCSESLCSGHLETRKDWPDHTGVAISGVKDVHSTMTRHGETMWSQWYSVCP